MSAFFSARGCVLVVGGAPGAGFYRVQGLRSGSGKTPVLISGIQYTDTDVILPVTTLESFKVLYSFGEGFGNFAVTGTLLLGPSGKTPDCIKDLTSWFKNRRTANNDSPVNVSAPGGVAYKVFFNGLGISGADPAYHTLTFSLQGVIAEPSS